MKLYVISHSAVDDGVLSNYDPMVFADKEKAIETLASIEREACGDEEVGYTEKEPTAYGLSVFYRGRNRTEAYTLSYIWLGAADA